MHSPIRWVAATYTAIHTVLTNPVYAGAYAYGKSRHERYVHEEGRLRKRTRLLPQAEWAVLLPDHHWGYIDWAKYQASWTRRTGWWHAGWKPSRRSGYAIWP
jgi:hypothetical protein